MPDGTERDASVVDGVSAEATACAGVAMPTIAAANPVAAMVANPNFVILVPTSSSFFVLREPGLDRLVHFLFVRYAFLNRQFTALIPLTGFDRRLAGIRRSGGPTGRSA